VDTKCDQNEGLDEVVFVGFRSVERYKFTASISPSLQPTTPHPQCSDLEATKQHQFDNTMSSNNSSSNAGASKQTVSVYRLYAKFLR